MAIFSNNMGGPWPLCPPPGYAYELSKMYCFICRRWVCAFFSLQSWGCLLSLTLFWPFNVSHLLALLAEIGLMMGSVTWNRFPIKNLRLIPCLLSPVEWSNLSITCSVRKQIHDLVHVHVNDSANSPKTMNLTNIIFFHWFHGNHHRGGELNA